MFFSFNSLTQSRPRSSFIFLFFLALLSVGCATRERVEAPIAYLKPSVGLKIISPSEYDSFPAYAAAVEEQLRQHRVPFDAEQAELEIDRAKPIQFEPEPECTGQKARGIAILVHGLSDTAFAMNDVGRVIASECFIARTVLLPGHGTRAGDLLTTDLTDWQTTVSELVNQAAAEHNNIVLGGFSLGAVLTLANALDEDSPVDALMAFSPAYTLSSYKLARYAPYVRLFRPWVDRELPDDYVRYEAMPMRGVAETVNAMKLMYNRLARRKTIDIPLLMVQSMDDAVILPHDNMRLFQTHAVHPKSRIVNFYTDQNTNNDANTLWVRGDNESMRVLGISHVGVANSPQNVHYGINGDYKNCGVTAPRDPAAVAACLEADEVWYGLWNKPTPPELPSAISSFNPQFDVLAEHIAEFLQ